MNKIIKTYRTFIAWGLLIFSHPAAAQPALCFPKQDKGKWGIAKEDEIYKKKSLIKVDVWVHKPQWDYVRVDTMRYGCQSGRTCDGFVTYKDGLYGYAWCDGTKWKNEYQFLDLSNHVAKKNGLWGALNNETVLIPFEYDTLYYLRNARLYYNDYTSGYDTAYFYFTARKNFKWYSFLAKQVKSDGSVILVTLSETDRRIENYDNGVIVSKDNKFRFLDLRNVKRQKFSRSYDSIKEINVLYAVKYNEKWFLTHPNFPDAPNGKGWDSITSTGAYNYIAVWENGLAGLVEYSDNYLKEAFKPRGTEVTVFWKKSGRYVIKFKENGQYRTYNEKGTLLSRSGDISVKSGRTAGPFWIEEHEDYGYVTVYDNNSNELLIEKFKAFLSYEKDPVAGDILHIEQRQYGLYYYGLYHFNSRTEIKAIYRSPIQAVGKELFIGRNGSDSCIVFSRSDITLRRLPFKVTDYKFKYQNILRDENGGWHEAESPYAVVSNSKVVLEQKTLLPGLVVEETIDNRFRLIKLQGMPADKIIESYSWSGYGKILSLRIDGMESEYYESENRTMQCHYVLPAGYSVLQKIMPDKPWRNEHGLSPVVLADSAGQLILVNMENNKIIRLHLVMKSDSLVYNGKTVIAEGFGVCEFTSTEYLNICGTRMRGCRACDALGFVTRTVKETIKGESTYTTVKTTVNKSSSESVWDPKTNSYKWVEVQKPETQYNTVEKKGEDKIVEKQVQEKCEQCHGTGKIYYQVRLIWNGTDFILETEE